MATSTHRRSSDSNRSPSISEGLHELGAAAREVAADQVEAIRDRAGEVFERGRDRARSVSEDFETRLRDQPMKSVLIAAGIGFLLGIFWGRR